MPTAVLIDSQGVERTVDAEVGESLMDIAVNNDISGIEGECGGEMSCGTCHIYVDDDWYGRLPPQDDDEADAIDTLVVDEVRPTSRLGCQIRMSPELDGISVTVPQE